MAFLDWVQQLIGGGGDQSGQQLMQQNPQTGAFEAYAPPPAPSALDMLANLTGARDMQQAYQAAGRGEYLPALGQGAWGAGQAASLAVPALRSGMAAVRAGAPVAREMAGAFPAFLRDEFGGIKAYHASPYDFDRFDLSKVGTGQGAQSFGHGIYAAESPAVSGPKGSYDIEFTARNLGKPDLNQGEASVLRMLRDKATDMDIIGDLGRNGYSFEDALSTLNRVKDARAKIYEVDLNADPQRLLDWDKPLMAQSKSVGDALAELGFTPQTSSPLSGQQIYRALEQSGDPADVAQRLRELGIPGTRYLDQGSRGAGQDTSNYVMFDPALITILRKYGILGPVAGAGLLGAADQQ